MQFLFQNHQGLQYFRFERRATCSRHCKHLIRNRPRNILAQYADGLDDMKDGCLRLGALMLEDYTIRGKVEKFQFKLNFLDQMCEIQAL